MDTVIAASERKQEIWCKRFFPSEDSAFAMVTAMDS